MSYDPHRKAAAVMFGIPESEVTDKQRRAGKVYNVAREYKASHATAMRLALKEERELRLSFYCLDIPRYF
ncbi:hypothetical protein [Acinetobacter phage vB_AbaM_CP14]|nr:hypothetical protein [Acinetobacter phage vB_AbaM_CP14]